MAIEIKELVIRAIVSDDNITTQKNQEEKKAKGESDNESVEEDNEDIINACVDQVLEILEKRLDR